MALLSYVCSAPDLITDSCLGGWEVIGSGGFGQVYRARHRKLCCDVAIKLLHYDDGRSSKSLQREIDMMRQGCNPHVIQVLGVFQGQPPYPGPTQLGMVMEFMERGSLASLQETLEGTLPWPLVFRLAHQLALGINFLHNKTPPLLHLDLKPSNVMLDSYLNAKLTDFGLARFYQSQSRFSKRDSEGGTISYMPPEAFDLSYTPTMASDIYSYGILLWSIVTGKQPYPNALSTIVRFRIPKGDRPLLEEIRVQAAGLAGLTGLMELMEKCWEAKPTQRPTSLECSTETEELYKVHKHAINDAVHQVLVQLDRREEEALNEQMQRIHIGQHSVRDRIGAVNVDNVLTGRPPIQEMAGGGTPDRRDKPRVTDSSPPQHQNTCEADKSRQWTDPREKVSSVHPIPPPFPPAERSHQGSEALKTHQRAFEQNQCHQMQRQISSPDTFPCRHANPAPPLTIHLSNVVGFQHGNNNYMYINQAHPLDRKRHPTAPSRVDLPPPRSGSFRDKKGGAT